MDLNFSVLQEPRGVMRIFHFVFAICAFATTVNFEGYVLFNCPSPVKFIFEYPFKIILNEQVNSGAPECSNSTHVTSAGDFSSDARFFVCTGVLSMLYAVCILLLYTKFDNMYKTNDKIPLTDFILSVILAILWLSSSAAWANGLTALKHVTDPNNFEWNNTECKCDTNTGSFSTLTISVILGFLNFFLWAANLWFLYKETKWFQKPTTPSGGV